MKIAFNLVTACLLSLSAVAADKDPAKTHNKAHKNYCAQMQDGLLVVMHEGKKITADAMLPDGTIIKATGMVVKKDGSQVMLKEGQCVDKDGDIGNEKPTKKNKQ